MHRRLCTYALVTARLTQRTLFFDRKHLEGMEMEMWAVICGAVEFVKEAMLQTFGK
jgi:hypothetical protein